MPAYFTVGHSTRSVSEFIALLQSAGVKLLADVRSIPRSLTNPQFNIEALPPELAANGIADSPNEFWEHASFRNYADYAGTPAFRAGLERLRRLGQQRCTAIMCAEAVWWRCHRRIVADYLIAAGDTVFHILAAGKIEPAKLTPAARRTPEGILVYPR